MDKPIALNLPYPELKSLCRDNFSARVISPAYAGGHGELTSVLQYVYHGFWFENEGDAKTASVLLGISVAEMRHLDLIGKTLLALGVDPVFARFPPYKCDFYSSTFVNYSKNPKKMLLDDIAGELKAINDYKEMQSVLKNEEVSALISRIVLDEELHVKVLKERLFEVCGTTGI